MAFFVSAELLITQMVMIAEERAFCHEAQRHEGAVYD
jgi:hypothetical protein